MVGPSNTVSTSATSPVAGVLPAIPSNAWSCPTCPASRQSALLPYQPPLLPHVSRNPLTRVACAALPTPALTFMP
ncbi:hypothetical protein E2C01_058067 [Portunus trituberculatus]|uniref:Uncharacterized protein n=1 Tax=Portunus trituberculatus TaxID=210409 RepID=A0A5B7H206_PORTR|nr:hypothetical protein [Portunus trituberculatus]